MNSAVAPNETSHHTGQVRSRSRTAGLLIERCDLCHTHERWVRDEWRVHVVHVVVVNVVVRVQRCCRRSCCRCRCEVLFVETVARWRRSWTLHSRVQRCHAYHIQHSLQSVPPVVRTGPAGNGKKVPIWDLVPLLYPFFPCYPSSSLLSPFPNSLPSLYVPFPASRPGGHKSSFCGSAVTKDVFRGEGHAPNGGIATNNRRWYCLYTYRRETCHWMLRWWFTTYA